MARLAKYESNQGHTVLVYDNKATASLIGRSGRSLSYEYVSTSPQLLKSVAACAEDCAEAIELLNACTHSGLVWSAA